MNRQRRAALAKIYEAADAAVDAMQEAIDQLSDVLDSIEEAQA